MSEKTSGLMCLTDDGEFVSLGNIEYKEVKKEDGAEQGEAAGTRRSPTKRLSKENKIKESSEKDH